MIRRFLSRGQQAILSDKSVKNRCEQAVSSVRQTGCTDNFCHALENCLNVYSLNQSRYSEYQLYVSL